MFSVSLVIFLFQQRIVRKNLISFFFFFLEIGVGFCLNLLPKDKRISRNGDGSPLIQDPPDGIE